MATRDRTRVGSAREAARGVSGFETVSEERLNTLWRLLFVNTTSDTSRLQGDALPAGKYLSGPLNRSDEVKPASQQVSPEGIEELVQLPPSS